MSQPQKPVYKRNIYLELFNTWQGIDIADRISIRTFKVA